MLSKADPALSREERSQVEKICDRQGGELKLSCEQTAISGNWNNLL